MLQVGQAAETVSVTGHPPLLESESSSVGTVINQQLVNELPLNGRNFVQLATLSPGVNGVGQSASGTIMGGTRPDDRRAGNEIFSNGNREGDNNFLYDGIDNNERLTLSVTLRPAVDSVREFKIQTNLYSADVGRNSGAVIDIISKSGTNQLHGSLFEFLRNSDVDARTFFNAAGTSFPHLPLESIWRLFGRTRGHTQGLSRERQDLFLRGLRRLPQQFADIRAGQHPHLRMRQGDFGELLPGTLIYDPLTTGGESRVTQRFPSYAVPKQCDSRFDRFDPIAYKMINAYPTPTSTARLNNYAMPRIQTQNYDQGDVRVDEQITAKDSIFARWSIQDTTTISPSTYAQIHYPRHLYAGESQ